MADSLPGGKRVRPLSRLKKIVANFLIAGIFLGFAALITALAPTFDLRFVRAGQKTADLQIRRMLLWVVPVSTQVVNGVTMAGTTTQTPQQNNQHRSASDRAFGNSERGGSSFDYQQVTVGELVFSTAQGEVHILADDKRKSEFSGKIRDFLSSSNPELRLRVPANWMVGVVIPGIIALLAVLPLLSLIELVFFHREPRSGSTSS